MEYFCYQSTGNIFVAENWWMFLACNQDIVDFYTWLSIRNGLEILKGSKRGPHISFVKGEQPKDLELWQNLQGKEVQFKYSNCVRDDNNYHVWIDVELEPFNAIRNSLGLPNYKSFHITLGKWKYGQSNKL